MTFGRQFTVLALLVPLSFNGCSQRPLALMDGYLGPAGQKEGGVVYVQQMGAPGPVEAGLLLINDTTAEGSAPAFSEATKAFLSDQVRRRAETSIPVRIVKVLTLEGSAQPRDHQGFVKMARDQGLSHLLVALFSSAESEVPMMLPFTADPEQGGGRPNALGFEAVNYALAELALIDASGGQVVARSNGRAWGRLNRLNVPVKSNGYPVIHRSLRAAPIYPTEVEAKDVLRSIAGDEALEQAIYKLEQSWPKS
jgi:hypothetical protein